MENSIGSVVIEILSYKQNNFTTLYTRIRSKASYRQTDINQLFIQESSLKMRNISV